MRIGIFGGTFDPPHFGHLIPVESVVQEVNLDAVHYMPAYIPPHKRNEQLTDPYHRTAMLALAIQHCPKYRLLPLELEKGKVSFTVDTIQEIKHMLAPEDACYFIIGTDSFLEIDTWYQYENLIQLCNFIIINRGTGGNGTDRKVKVPGNDTASESERYIPLRIERDFSNFFTEIRAAAAEGKSLKGLVPDEVANYIQRHALYQRR